MQYFKCYSTGFDHSQWWMWMWHGWSHSKLQQLRVYKPNLPSRWKKDHREEKDLICTSFPEEPHLGGMIYFEDMNLPSGKKKEPYLKLMIYFVSTSWEPELADFCEADPTKRESMCAGTIHPVNVAVAFNTGDGSDSFQPWIKTSAHDIHCWLGQNEWWIKQ